MSEFLTLWNERRELLKQSDLAEQQEERLDDLAAAHWAYASARSPRVSCCQRGKDNLRAFVPEEDADIYPGDAKAEWKIGDCLGVSGCPFCLTPVPRLIHAPRDDERYTAYEDGGYYCCVCHERLMGCLCLPTECAWEAAK